MTIIGKILTFLLFVLSLVFLGLAISVNRLNKDPVSQKSWHEVAQMRKEEAERLRDAFLTKSRECTEAQAHAQKLEQQLKLVQAESDKRVREVEAKAQAEAQRAADLRTSFEKAQIALSAAENELKQRREEASKLYGIVKEKDLAIAELQKNLGEERNLRIQEETTAKAYAERIQQLEKANNDLTRQLEEERERLFRATPKGAERGIVNPPPHDIEGRILKVSPEGLVEISLGSDQGLLRGHTLEVFRLQPQAKYLGRISIIEVKTHRAVGRILDYKRYGKLIQEGDIVANRVIPQVQVDK